MSPVEAAVTAHDAFSVLVRQLCQLLNADLVFLGKFTEDRVTILAAWSHGGEIQAFDYQLPGSPCAEVLSGIQCYPKGVRSLFPDDVGLAEMAAEGFIGAPLYGRDGTCIGMLCAITRQPLKDPAGARGLLTIAAMGAAAQLPSIELQTRNSGECLARAEERWRSFALHSNEAIVRFALEKPIPLDLPEDEVVDLAYRYAYVDDCNDQAAALFGVDRASLVGAPLEIVSKRADPEQMERLLAFIRARFGFSQVERKLMGRHLLMTREGILDGDKLIGAWVTGRDITELKAAETQVRELNRELEARVGELSELRARLELDNDYLREEIQADHPFQDMVGSSACFRELTGRIQMVASTSATVLISGETGTGKELVARAIHNLSDRRNRPLVKVNCAAIASGLVESELFGHVKGAFTGAIDRRIGRFEYANGGTLFLDEITELPLEMQAKLLRLLQEHEFEPVGSNRTVKVDVRLLAATNRSLTDAVREGRFRMDLYYRLLVVPVEVPSLRERSEDIPALAAHFIARHSRQFGRRVEGISSAMMNQLVAAQWPGNIRELDNVLARAVVLSTGGVLNGPFVSHESEADAGDKLPRTMEDVERLHIEKTLRAAGWVLEGPKGAAALLGLNPSTLRGRMKRLGIRRG